MENSEFNSKKLTSWFKIVQDTVILDPLNLRQPLRKNMSMKSTTSYGPKFWQTKNYRKLFILFQFTLFFITWFILPSTAFYFLQEGTWTFYFHESGYASDYYPTVSTFGFDVPGVTNAITYKLQGRKYSGNSDRFATQFGEAQNSSVVGDTMVMKLEELSV